MLTALSWGPWDAERLLREPSEGVPGGEDHRCQGLGVCEAPKDTG